MCIHLCVLVRIPQRAKTPPTGIRYPKWCQCSPCEWCCISASLCRERNVNGSIREIAGKSRCLSMAGRASPSQKNSKRRRGRRAPSLRSHAGSGFAVRTPFLRGAPSIPRALNDEAGPQARKDARVHAPRRPGSSRCSLCAKLQAKPTETVRPGTPGRVRSDERNTIRWTRNVASAEEHRASLAAAACRASTILGAQRPFSCTTAARAIAQAAVLGGP